MTYARQANTWAAAVTWAAQVLGRDALARRLGVSASRVDQLRNPMRRDLALLDQAVAIDAALAAQGYGTPIFDLYASRLGAAGHGVVPSQDGAASLSSRRPHLEAAARSCLPLLRRGLALLENALEPVPAPALAAE